MSDQPLDPKKIKKRKRVKDNQDREIEDEEPEHSMYVDNDALRKISVLLAENTALREENAKLKQKLDTITAENQELKAKLAGAESMRSVLVQDFNEILYSLKKPLILLKVPETRIVKPKIALLDNLTILNGLEPT